MQSVTKVPRAQLVVSANEIKARLRPMISDWTKQNPGRIVMRVPISSFDKLLGDNLVTRFTILDMIDCYVGTAIPDGTTPIPFPYELHVMMTSEVIEVLILSKKFMKYRFRTFRSEAAMLAHEHAIHVDIDYVFTFRLPECVVAYVNQLDYSRRSRFNTELKEQLLTEGLGVLGGSVSGGLEIRRNR